MKREYRPNMIRFEKKLSSDTESCFQRNSKIALEREVRAKKDELVAVQDKIRQEERKAIETQRLIDGMKNNDSK